MIKRIIRNRFPNLWKIYKIQTSKEIIENIKKEDNKIFIFLAADYPNFGDIAITYAQKTFLENCYPKYKIIEIPADKTLSLIKAVKKVINKNDIITLVGGGNMGNIYEYYEDLRRTVIKKFKENVIISFPQTIDFSEDKFGQRSLNKTINTIKKKKNILVFAREEKSYKKMKECYGSEKVKLAPDIVLYLKQYLHIKTEKMSNIGICFRKDKEENLNYNEYKKQILEKVKDKQNIIFDTVLGNDEFNYIDRYEKLFEILNTIATCDAIYTNRLHAMIFSYLVGTKCYFIDNTNKKLSETYKKWLANVDYIHEYGKYKNEKLEINLEKEFDDMKKEIIRITRI